MKKLLLFALSASLILGSCKDPKPEPEPSVTYDGKISFTAEINTATKVSGSNFEFGDEILVKSDDSQEATYSYGSSSFTSDSPIEKESEATTLGYTAIYPAQSSYSNSFTFNIEENQSTEEAYVKSDLLVAQVAPTNETQPNLSFDHKLSSVIFSIKVEGVSDAVVSDAKISALNSVSVDIDAEKFSGTGDLATIIPTPNSGSYKVMIAPQSYGETQEFASFVYDGDLYPVIFGEETKFESGWQYTLEFIINPIDKTAHIDFIDATIDNWKNGNLFNPSAAGDLSMSLVSVSEIDIVVDVDMGDFAGTYYVGLTSTDYYDGSPEDFAALLMDNEINYYGTDLSIVDNIWVFDSNKEISLDLGWNISAGTEYIVAAFGMNAQGEVLTNVATIIATTKAIEIAGSIAIEVNEVTDKDIVITTTPTAEVGNYICGLVETSSYLNEEQGYGGDPVAVTGGIIYVYQYSGIDMSTADGIYVQNGTAEVSFAEVWGVNPDTDYTIFTFGVDAAGNVTSEITEMAVTSGAGEPKPDLITDFNASLVSVSSSDIIINVDKGSYTGNYYLGLAFPNDDPEDAAAALIDDEINYYGTDLSVVDNMWIYSEGGEIAVSQGWQISASTEYQVLVFGVDAQGNILTNIASVIATTESVETAGSIEISVVEAGTSSITVSATPSAEVGNYIYGLIETSDYEDMFESEPISTAAAVSSMYKQYFNDFSVADNRYILNGEAEFDLSNFWAVNPITDYTILVFGVDAVGNPNSEIAVTTVTTPDTAKLDGTIGINNINVVSNSEVSCDIAISGEINKWYWNVLSKSELTDNYENNAKSYMTELIAFEKMYFGTDFSVADNIYIYEGTQEGLEICEIFGQLGIGEDYVILAVAVDDDGNLLSEVAEAGFSTPAMEQVGTPSYAPRLKTTFERKAVVLERTITKQTAQPIIMEAPKATAITKLEMPAQRGLAFKRAI